MKPGVKRWLERAGALVAIGGMIFVGVKLARAGRDLRLDTLTPDTWLWLVLLSVVYAAGGGLLALSWRQTLLAQGVMTTPAWAVRIYGVSQLGKYVPGNVFQFAGRQAMGLAAGLPGWKLAASSVHELLLLAAGGVAVGLLGAPILLRGWPAPAALASFAALALLMTLAAWRLKGGAFARASLGYTAFLLLSGSLFVFTLQLVAPGLQLPWAGALSLCGGYVLAWLAGFVTPGSPAGLGVREATSLLLFEHLVPPSELLVAMALARAVTTLGDVLFFLGAWVVKAPARRRLEEPS